MAGELSEEGRSPCVAHMPELQDRYPGCLVVGLASRSKEDTG